LKIAQEEVAILLSDEGHSVLQLAVPELPEGHVILLQVYETDELGAWIRLKRNDGDHVVLVRWEYILTIDLRVKDTQPIGLRP
jgi:hypothetical protein